MDKQTKLKLMVFWLFGTFLIIFAATTVYIGIWTGTLILGVWQYWASMGIMAVLCVIAYYVYRAYLNRQEE